MILYYGWTISRAVDTYGQNRLTVRDSDGNKAAVVGGGYDMIAAALAEYLDKYATPKMRRSAAQCAAYSKGYFRAENLDKWLGIRTRKIDSNNGVIIFNRGF